jgi:hypothetical protein
VVDEAEEGYSKDCCSYCLPSRRDVEGELTVQSLYKGQPVNLRPQKNLTVIILRKKKKWSRSGVMMERTPGPALYQKQIFVPNMGAQPKKKSGLAF